MKGKKLGGRKPEHLDAKKRAERAFRQARSFGKSFPMPVPRA